MWGAGHCVGNRILFVSRFERIKGPDIMLRAFSRVLETVPDAELDFVGSDDGFIDDAGRTWTLQDYLAAHLPVHAVHRVKYHGRLPRERIEELRKVSRVAVIASRHENFPLAAIESMCAGTPTIGSDVGGIPEIIRDEQTGLLFRAGDAEHLASQIGRILLGPDLSERLSAAAVGETSRFTSDAVALQTLGFYDTALAHAGK